jgi:hypothetical protein
MLSGRLAVSPRSEYRDLLERWVSETRAQAQALRLRLERLGVAPGRLRSLGRRMIAGARTPLALGIGLGRGSAGAEQSLRGARDLWAPASLLAASYEALEAAATEVGDESTALLARAGRSEKSRMLDELHAVLALLVQDVAVDEPGSPGGGGRVGSDVAARALAAAREAAAAVRAARDAGR